MAEIETFVPTRPCRILVIGGTGFLGQLLAHHLIGKGFSDISFLVHRNTPAWLAECPVTIINGSLADQNSLARALRDKDLLVTMLRPDGTGWCQDAMAAIVSAAASSGISRVIHLSSIDVYGSVSQLAVDEETIPKPLTRYAKEHLAIEQLVRSHVPAPCILRLGAVFGEGGRNVISFAEEAKHASRFRLSIRRILYGRRRMHLVSAETVCCAIAALIAVPGNHGADPVVLVTDDCDERNNFSFLQDQLLAAAGRSSLRVRLGLPSIILQLFLLLKGQPVNIAMRRFSGKRLGQVLTRRPDFALTLGAYITQLFRKQH